MAAEGATGAAHHVDYVYGSEKSNREEGEAHDQQTRVTVDFILQLVEVLTEGCVQVPAEGWEVA